MIPSPAHDDHAQCLERYLLRGENVRQKAQLASNTVGSTPRCRGFIDVASLGSGWNILLLGRGGTTCAIPSSWHWRPAVAGAAIPGEVEKGQEFTYAKDGFVASAYDLPTDQYGTQLDPPAHWDEYGATISDLPATYAVRPLVVIDIHEKVAADPGTTRPSTISKRGRRSMDASRKVRSS